MIKLHSVVGPVETRVVNWIQGHSHLISRVIVLGYLGTRKFSRVTILTRYHVSIVELTKQDLKSEVVKLFRGPRTLIKIFYFVSLWPGSKLFYLLAGDGLLLTVKATGVHLTGSLGQVVSTEKQRLFEQYKITSRDKNKL